MHVCAYFNFRVRVVDGLGLEIADWQIERARAGGSAPRNCQENAASRCRRIAGMCVNWRETGLDLQEKAILAFTEKFTRTPRQARSAFILLTVLLTLPLASAAQTTATLAGRVLDSSGAVLPGVAVTARQTGTGLQRSATSDTQGRYIVAALSPGTYEIRAELSGFRPLSRSGVTLTIAQTAVVDLTLTVGGVAEEVTVVGEASAVNTRTGELGYLVDERAIEELPLNGRNYTDLALLQPSVVAYPHRDGGSVVAHGLGMSVNGQDPRSNVYLLDGTLLNDMTNGPAGSAAGTALGMETCRSSASRPMPTAQSSGG